MPSPGIITGSSLRRTDTVTDTDGIKLFKDTSGTEIVPASGLGVFGAHPGATPKYAFNTVSKTRDAEYRETMARLYIELPNEKARARFLETVSKNSQQLASVLTSAKGTGGSGGTGFIDFLLTGAQETFQEKTQIVDTLTDNYVAFYSGREPPAFSYTGVLLNTYQDDQRVWFWRLYQEILRGSRLATRNLILHLRYDSFIVSGYMETLQMGISGDSDLSSSQFAFTIRVKRMSVFTQALGAPTLVNEPTPDSDFDGIVPQRQAAASAIEPPTATRKPAAQQLEELEASVAANRRARAQAALSRATDAFLNVPPTTVAEGTAEARLSSRLATGEVTGNTPTSASATIQPITRGAL